MRRHFRIVYDLFPLIEIAYYFIFGRFCKFFTIEPGERCNGFFILQWISLLLIFRVAVQLFQPLRLPLFYFAEFILHVLIALHVFFAGQLVYGGVHFFAVLGPFASSDRQQ